MKFDKLKKWVWLNKKCGSSECIKLALVSVEKAEYPKILSNQTILLNEPGSFGKFEKNLIESTKNLVNRI